MRLIPNVQVGVRPGPFRDHPLEDVAAGRPDRGVPPGGLGRRQDLRPISIVNGGVVVVVGDTREKGVAVGSNWKNPGSEGNPPRRLRGCSPPAVSGFFPSCPSGSPSADRLRGVRIQRRPPRPAAFPCTALSLLHQSWVGRGDSISGQPHPVGAQHSHVTLLLSHS